MKVVAQTEGNATLAGGHRLVVNLMFRNGGLIEVRSCEVIGQHHRNRFTFPNSATIEDVFVEQLADGINHCLNALSNKTEVVSLPSVSIELPGLSLARVNLITTKGDDGTLAVMMRFKTLLGGVARAFRPELGIEDSVSDYASHMSALVLTDIVLPLLNLCEVVDNEGFAKASDVDDFMDTLIERSREVRFQAELIKRFVSTASTSTPAPQLNSPRGRSIELVKGK